MHYKETVPIPRLVVLCLPFPETLSRSWRSRRSPPPLLATTPVILFLTGRGNVTAAGGEWKYEDLEEETL